MNTAITRPAPRLNLRHLLAVGVVLPACLAGVNHLLLTSGLPFGSSPTSLCLLMGLYVLQIGFIGWAVATYIQPWPLRWFIYGWIMVLVDIQLSAMMSNGGEGITCLATAMLAGQLGMIIVWGILGTGHWVWRVPAWLVVLNQFWAFFNLLVLLKGQSANSFTGNWDGLVTTQAVLLSILCGILRLRGYSLLKLESGSETEGGERSKAPLQFGIRDVLIWTTSLAVLLGIGKAGDLLTWSYFKQIYSPGTLLLLTIGICTAVVLLVALWSALGRGRAWLRYMVLAVISLGMGTGIGWFCTEVVKRSLPSASWTYSYWHWYSTGYWWIGWMFLTGALLAASLIIYRTLGYRLVRSVKRPTGTSAAVAAVPECEGTRRLGCIGDAYTIACETKVRAVHAEADGV